MKRLVSSQYYVVNFDFVLTKARKLRRKLVSYHNALGPGIRKKHASCPEHIQDQRVGNQLHLMLAPISGVLQAIIDGRAQLGRVSVIGEVPIEFSCVQLAGQRLQQSTTDASSREVLQALLMKTQAPATPSTFLANQVLGTCEGLCLCVFSKNSKDNKPNDGSQRCRTLACPH